MSQEVTQNIDRELDLSNAGRGVWLVKVPKYIAQKWEKAPSQMDVGKLRIEKIAGQKAVVSLSLSNDVVNLEPEVKIPTEHKLDVSVVTKQTLGVFSHVIPASKEESEKLYMEGRIVQKLECRPVADTSYMKLKMESFKKAAVPQKKVQAIDKIVQNFKPVKDHRHNIDYVQKKKAEGKKARDDKNFVMDMLFNAFEKHQYYNIKDLVKITKQPIGYLKEILKEVCDYNMKNPHKNMWELKKEYRHYKADKDGEGDDKSDDEGDTEVPTRPAVADEDAMDVFSDSE